MPRAPSASARTSSGGSLGFTTIVIHNLPTGGDRVVDIGVTHRRKNRQRKNLFIGRFCIWTEAGAGGEMLAVVGMKMNRQIMHVDADTFGPQGGENLPPVHCQVVAVQL